MKTILSIILASSFIVAYASHDDCSKEAQEVVNKLSAHNRTFVTINYSVDQAAREQTCENAIKAKNKDIIVNKNQVDRSGVFNFSK